MITQLIQRQVPLGSKVNFSLKSGEVVSGTLVELGLNHVTINRDSGLFTALIEMIGAWQVLDKLPMSEEKISQVVDNEKSQTSLLTNQAQAVTSESALPSPSGRFEPDVMKKMLEIEARFQAKSDAASIEVLASDFVFPDSELKSSIDASTIWNRVKDRYNYAVKINELSSKFGRIQPLVSELKILSERFPDSDAVKRHLAYLHWLSGNMQEALKLYKEIALSSKESWDWYNAAVSGLANRQEQLCCYCLEQFFNKISIIEAKKAWYLQVRLLKKYSNYRALKKLLEGQGRAFSSEEIITLLETSVYFLKADGNEQLAMKTVRQLLSGQPIASVTLDVINHFDKEPVESYQALTTELAQQETKKPNFNNTLIQPQGDIYDYNSSRAFGFIRGVDEKEYFFHRSAIVDDDVLERINNIKVGKRIPVVFETAKGPKGPIAIGITLYRTVEEMYSRANEYANDGDYSKAIAQIKKVIEINPNCQTAKESYEKWREYARVSGIPKGSTPYARAKRVQLIEKDLDKAAQLLRTAIEKRDNTESAVKDLAGLLAQQGKPEDAIRVLEMNRGLIQNQQSIDNMLIGFYQIAGQHDNAIALLKKKHKQAISEGKKAEIMLQIANSYMRKEDYLEAERSLNTVLKLQPDHRAAQRNFAICLFKLGHYEEAQKRLEQILNIYPDAQAASLLEAVTLAKAGHLHRFDEIIIETTLSDFSREISGFTQFFLDRCDFQAVDPDRVKGKNFTRADIQQLEKLATELGTRKPRDRAAYYLSAARIVSFLEDEDPKQFYKYLCRSFASRGDAIVIESRPLDSAREFYCESLSIYDVVRSESKEQDAVNALVRFLFSTLGQAQIPIKPGIPPIDETIETVLSHHPDRNKVFDAIAYLVFRSRYAANRILNRLYDKLSLQAMALEYLKSKDVLSVKQIKRLDDFVHLWNDLNRIISDNARSVSSEFRFLLNVGLTTASIEDSIERVKGLVNRLFFDLDKQRVIHLQRIFEMALELCKQNIFEEQERLCIQIDNRCQDLLREIEISPTKLSVEEIYPVVESFQKKVKIKLEEIYESSTPQLTLRLPVESYTPDSNQRIEVQVTVNNRNGCSPAEALELVVQEYEDTFTVRLDGSLRGGDPQILKIPIKVGEEDLHSQAFSLPVYAQYRTRSGEIVQTPVNNFSIRLTSGVEFEEIANPYAAYAEGGIVNSSEMFYGREELIANVAKAIKESLTQSKCVVIYGQKRAGKSSILHHLKVKLQSDKRLLILDVGNIGSILDDTSKCPFLYQILWSILSKLEYAIEDRVTDGFSSLNLTFPTYKEFYDHPSPLVFFKNLFEQFRRVTAKSQDWRGTQLVLLIDEFSYIFAYIKNGLIPESVMKNWKALLQENYFSAVLVGQDVMPRFKQRFPNEFGTTQDERVNYLKREDAEKLIDEPVRIGGRQGKSRYRERAIGRIIKLTAGSPFYIQILCNRLVEYMNRKSASLVTEADVDQVKEELIRGTNALGLDKFDNLLNSGDTSEDAIKDQDALNILSAIAVNSHTGPCSRHSIDCKTDALIDEILEDLVKRDIVERLQGQYYSIRLGLFKDWLIAHQ